WLVWHIHRFTVTDYFFTVLLDVWQLTRTCSCSNDGMCSFIYSCFSVSSNHFHLLTRPDLSRTHNYIDFVLFHEELDPFAHPVCHIPTAFHDGTKISFSV